MRRNRRVLLWSVYGAGSAAVLAGLGWISVQVVHLEREEASARAEIGQQETLHLALWRMDSWLGPLLAREGARTWFEYQPYYPETLALNRLCEPLAPGSVVMPSPLLGFRSDFFPLHVQFAPDAGFTSPQLPSPDIVEKGVVGCVPLAPDPTIGDQLREFARENDGLLLLSQVIEGESRVAESFTPGHDEQPPSQWRSDAVQPGIGQKLAKESAEFNARMQNWQAQSAVQQTSGRRQTRAQQTQSFDQQIEALVGVGATAEVGPMVPIWMGSPPEQLLLARRVTLGPQEILQGVLIDWLALRRELLERVRDLYPAPGAMLDPVAVSDTPTTGTLASLPVRFVPPAEPAPEAAVGRGVRVGLGVVWLLALGAIATSGIAMRGVIRSAVRTNRFASSVTHELRTPLTTFRLYAEMLSDGMVHDPERAKEYLRTLRDESSRLGLLVENVLAWSRLEEGRKAAEARPVAAADLIADAEPVLRRRCDEAGAELETRDGCDATALADPSRVRQILFNLVDNACKYAGEHPHVEVSAAQRNGSVVLAVEDNGPGIPAALRQRVFRAFDRGTLGPGDSVRGLGLGLSISLELAKSLGGSLHCGESTLGGARFELEIPAAGH